MIKYIVLLGTFVASLAVAAPQDNPLITGSALFGDYLGSFKVHHYGDGGANSTQYSYGTIAVVPGTSRLFITGGATTGTSPVQFRSIAEFAIPTTLGADSVPANLPNATITQGFVDIITKNSTGNPQYIDAIYGLTTSDAGELFAQCATTYDAAIDNTHTTLVVRDPSDIANSTVSGFYEVTGAARTTTYASRVPAEWQSTLGGDLLFGNGNGMSISARLSIGPSLYTTSASDFAGSSGVISSTEWQSYTVLHNLADSTYGQQSPVYNGSYNPWDAYNNVGLNSNFTVTNGLWTLGSNAFGGFIIPGTRTFVVIGYQYMNTSGGFYKETQDDGYLCPGPCAREAGDAIPYYWLFDLADTITATNPYDPVPYEYGAIPLHYTDYPGLGNYTPPWTGYVIRGVSYDEVAEKLYISIADGTTGTGPGYPVVEVYSLTAVGTPPVTSRPKWGTKLIQSVSTVGD